MHRCLLTQLCKRSEVGLLYGDMHRVRDAPASDDEIKYS